MNPGCPVPTGHVTAPLRIKRNPAAMNDHNHGAISLRVSKVLYSALCLVSHSVLTEGSQRGAVVISIFKIRNPRHRKVKSPEFSWISCPVQR